MGKKIESTEEWVMPDWMERYRDLILNTGGDSVESLMNDHHTTAFANVIRAGMIVSVDSQVQLLYRMAREGMLEDVDPKKVG